jgi:hypothetical protein
LIKVRTTQIFAILKRTRELNFVRETLDAAIYTGRITASAQCL